MSKLKRMADFLLWGRKLAKGSFDGSALSCN